MNSKNGYCLGYCDANDLEVTLARRALVTNLWQGCLPRDKIYGSKVLRLLLGPSVGTHPGFKIPTNIKNYEKFLHHQALFFDLQNMAAYAEIRVLENEEMVSAIFGKGLIENDQAILRALEKNRPVVYFACGARSKKAFNTILLPVLEQLLDPSSTLIIPSGSDVAEYVMSDVTHELKVSEETRKKIGGHVFSVLSEISIRHSRLSLGRHKHELDQTEPADFRSFLNDYLARFGR